MRWSDCIRTSLTDVSIFTQGEFIPLFGPEWEREDEQPVLTALLSSENRDSILSKKHLIVSTPFELAFADRMQWDIDPFTENCAKWINDPEVTDTSQVGAMSSIQFQDLIKPFVGDTISKEFRCMVYAISSARTQQGTAKKHQYTVLELQTLGSLAGEQLLHFLEKQLTPQSLANRSKNEQQVLFLMIIGTILAIGYAQPMVESPPFPSPDVSPLAYSRDVYSRAVG